MKKTAPRNFPLNAKLALALQASACVLFISFQVISTGTVSIVHLTAAFIILILLYSAKNAGRYLCMAYNILITAGLLNETYAGSAEGLKCTDTFVVNIICILLFLSATAFEASRETSDFYKNNASRQE